MPKPHPFQPPDKKLEKWKTPVTGFQGLHPHRLLVLEAYFEEQPDYRKLAAWEFLSHLREWLGDHRVTLNSDAESKLLFRTDYPWRSRNYMFTKLDSMLSWFSDQATWRSLAPFWSDTWKFSAQRGGGKTLHRVYELELWHWSPNCPATLTFGFATHHADWKSDPRLEKLVHAFFRCAADAGACYGRGDLSWTRNRYDIRPDFDDSREKELWRDIHNIRSPIIVPDVFRFNFLGPARARKIGGADAINKPLKIVKHDLRCEPMADSLLIGVNPINHDDLRHSASEFSRTHRVWHGFEVLWLLSRLSNAGMLPLQDMRWMDQQVLERQAWQLKDEQKRRDRRNAKPKKTRSLASWLTDLRSRPPRCIQDCAVPASDPLRGELAGQLHDGITHFHIRPTARSSATTLYGRAVVGESTLGSPIRAGSLKTDRALFTFDEISDGWDGQQGGEMHPPKTEPRLTQFKCPRCDGRSFNLRAAFEYPDDLDDSLDPRQKARAEDFFTWFWLIARCSACNWEGLAADIECA